MKKILGIIAATFFFLSAVTYARSECLPPSQPLDIFVQEVTKIPENKVQPATPSERANLLEKKGPPSNVEGDFDVTIARAPPVGMILIVKGECIVNYIGPAPLFLVEQLLGNTDS